MRRPRDLAESLREALKQNAYAVAIIAVALGDTEGTVEAILRVAHVEPQRLGRLLIEPDLAMVREDPRVRELRRTAGVP